MDWDTVFAYGLGYTLYFMDWNTVYTLWTEIQSLFNGLGYNFWYMHRIVYFLDLYTVYFLDWILSTFLDWDTVFFMHWGTDSFMDWTTVSTL